MLPGLGHLLLLLVVIQTCFLTLASAGPVIGVSPSTGNITVLDPNTRNPIPQFPATDGGAGTLENVIWIVFGGIVALPLGGAGVRIGRVAMGIAIGLTAAVSVWAAFINSLPMPFSSTPTASDLILTLIIVATFFFFTFLGAFLRFTHPFGLVLLGGAGGTSLMMRIVVIKTNLLFPLRLYALDIVLLVLGAVLGGLSMLWKRRLAVIVSSCLVATFFASLSIDIAIHMKSPPQEGMSRGLRLLMDRNPSHLADILGTDYKPTVSTQVILAISFGLVPILSYAQHRFFPGPYRYDLRPNRDSLDGDLNSLPGEPEWLTRAGGTKLTTRRYDADVEMMGVLRDLRPGGTSNGSRFSAG